MMNDEFVERFKREAKAAGRLHHPNVVNVTDFGFALVEGERIAYLVMEYLDGCTLAEVLAEESQLPIDWVVDIIEQTSSAIAEAHQQGIIHRDLKPDNIWLSRIGEADTTVRFLTLVSLNWATSNRSDYPSLEMRLVRKSVPKLATITIMHRVGIVQQDTYAQPAELSKRRLKYNAAARDDSTLIFDPPPRNRTARTRLPKSCLRGERKRQPRYNLCASLRISER